jgi:hypothetical protein
MAQGAYERVAAAAPSAADEAERYERDVRAAALRRRARQAEVEAISSKIHGALWVAGAVLTLYLTRVWSVALHDERVARGWLDLGLGGLGVDVACLLYLTVYLPYVARVHLSWDVYCPNVIPLATAAGVVAALGFTVGLWPVYGLLTVPILSVLFMGALMSTHFLPLP